MTICISEQEIIQIVDACNGVITFLNTNVRGRLGELQAIDVLSGLFPVGYVPADQDSLSLLALHVGQLELARNNADSAPVCTTDPTDPTDPDTGSGDDCSALVDAINDLQNIDIRGQIRAELNVFLANLLTYLKVDTQINLLNEINTKQDNLYNLVLEVLSKVEQVNNIAIRIEDLIKLIQSNGTNRDIEILERIEDTRIELREARERLIVIQECACNLENPDSTDIDIKLELDRIATKIINDIQVYDYQLITYLTGYLDLKFNGVLEAIAEMKASLTFAINNPSWLNILTDILELIDKTYNAVLKLGLDIDVGFNNIENLIDSLDLKLRGISTILDNLSVDINGLINSVIDLKNDLRIIINNTDDIKVDLQPIINLLRNVVDLLGDVINTTGLIKVDTRSLLDIAEQPINGNLLFEDCNNIQTLIPFGGSNWLSTSSQLGAISTQLRLMLSEICKITPKEPDINGNIATYDCQTESIINIPYTGKGLSALQIGLDNLSIEVANSKKEVCEIDVGCIALQPSDIYSEFPVGTQMQITLKEVGGTSKWNIHIPEPIDNLDWCTHIEPIVWNRGTIPGRIYFEGVKEPIGGYFETPEDATSTLLYLATLSKLPLKYDLPRITLNGSPKRKPSVRTTVPERVVIAKIGSDFEAEAIICLKRPIGGCG